MLPGHLKYRSIQKLHNVIMTTHTTVKWNTVQSKVLQILRVWKTLWQGKPQQIAPVIQTKMY